MIISDKLEAEAEVNEPVIEFKEIENYYGWLDCTYYPERALEHFYGLFSIHAGHRVEPDNVDRSAQLEPYLNYAEELLERFAKLEFERALKNLVLKIEVQTLIAIEGKEPKKATKLINELADKIKKEIKVDLNAPKHGGSRKELKGKHFTNDEDHIKYAEMVNNLRPLWMHITNFFRQEDYDKDCPTKVKKTSPFSALSQVSNGVPEDLLKKALRREDLYQLDEKTKLELTPLGLALEHASRELGIAQYQFETLKKHYNQGKKLLKAATKQN